MDITYDDMHEDEWEQCHHLRSSAFGARVQPDPEAPRFTGGQTRVARVNGDVVGTASAANFRQVFSGSTVPMSGITGVAIAPHAAGNGIAKRLVTDLLLGAAKRDQPISCLYPSTSTLYRSIGFETAGIWAEYAIPLADVHRRAPAGLTVEPTGPEVYLELRHLHEAQTQQSNGWMHRNDWWWNRLHYDAARYHRQEVNTHQRILVASDRNGPCALAVVRHTTDSPVESSGYDFKLDDLFGTPPGMQAIAAVLSSHDTMAGRLRTVLPITQISALTNRPEHARPINQLPWMERIISVPGSLALRPVGSFEGELHLKIHDPLLAANDNSFVLRSTAPGQALVETGGNGTIELAISDLAALYTGYQSATFLATAGRLKGASAADITRLDRCFAAQTPSLIDFF